MDFWSTQGITSRFARKSGTPAIAALLLYVAAANGPFLNQAFHMDDGIYLLLARNVQRNPAFPQDTPTLFEGLVVQDLASTEHPWPLTSYLMALCSHVGGFSERCLHAGFLVFSVLLAVSTYFMAKRFTRHAFLASLTLLTLPVVCVLSHTLMTDIPLLSLWLASMALFSRGVDSGKVVWVWIGTAVGILACLVTYSGLCLILLLAFCAILYRNRNAVLIAVLFPALALGAWVALNYFHYHRLTSVLLLSYYFFAKGVSSNKLLAEKSIYIVLFLGSVSVFPLFLIGVCRKKIAALAGAVLALAAVWLWGAAYAPTLKLLFVLLFAAGTTAIIGVVQAMTSSLAAARSNVRAGVDDLYLSIWFMGMLAFGAAVYMTGSARYLLPAMPPLVFLVFRRLESLLDEARLIRLASVNLTITLPFALLLSTADYQFADIYRDFASVLERAYPSRERNLWFSGEWGFRAYLERAGGQELGRRDSRPKPGDLLAVPALATPYHTLYSDTLSLESITMVAPCRLTFDIPIVRPRSLLVFTTGMPFHDKSDGMDFCVRFTSPDGNRVLWRSRVLPSEGRKWQAHEIALQRVAGKGGSIVFEADVGASGNADADWIAIGRARICERTEEIETPVYDFRGHLDDAHIEPAAAIQYHTDRNIPVFPMAVRLEQEPATVLLGRYEYRPALPLRLLDARCHAGFWSSAWGLLPFSCAAGDAPLESISVYEITRRVDSYSESTLSWYQK